MDRHRGEDVGKTTAVQPPDTSFYCVIMLSFMAGSSDSRCVHAAGCTCDHHNCIA